eukprot:216263-Chlamydomonas_euryale.AAC.6
MRQSSRSPRAVSHDWRLWAFRVLGPHRLFPAERIGWGRIARPCPNDRCVRKRGQRRERLTKVIGGWISAVVPHDTVSVLVWSKGGALSTYNTPLDGLS